MTANKRLLILPGDGIGPEVMWEVRRIIDWMDRRRSVTFAIEEGQVGGAAIDATGSPCPDETVEAAKRADAVLFGSVGGPKWDSLPFDRRPELGILRLRKDLGLFANLRPAVVLDALVDASSLKPDVVRGLDLMIVRESTGGIYFGEPRGITTDARGKRTGVDTEVYHEDEIARVARVAFDLAMQRRRKLTSVEKANVMQSGRLWRAVVTEVAAEYPDVELQHMYADNCAMQLCSRPKQFDVILGSNLFGDVLSDLAAALTGSLGMLPSATLGAVDATTGRRHALYEPIHGSAPDIAGRGIANPCAQMLSFAMLLRLSFGMEEDAALVEAAVAKVLGGGLRTADIMQADKARVGTSVMGEAVVRELEKLAA